MPRKRAAQKQTQQPSTPPRSRNRPQRAAAATARSNISSSSTPGHARVRFSDEEFLSTFRLFVIPATESDEEDDEDADEDDDEEALQLREEGKMPITDVRRALNALGLPKPPALGDLFEPGQQKVGAKEFLALARMLREVAEEEPGDEEDGDDEEEVQDWDAGEDDEDEQDAEDEHEDEDEEGGGGFVREKPKRRRAAQPATSTSKPAKGKAKGKARASAAEELESAWALFKRGGTGPITIADLRRVARELREDVDDAVLRLMLEEANGEAGDAAVRRGVGKDEFEGVMRRAGVFAR